MARIIQCAHNPVLEDLSCGTLQQLESCERAPIPFVEKDLQLPVPDERLSVPGLRRVHQELLCHPNERLVVAAWSVSTLLSVIIHVDTETEQEFPGFG